MTEKDFIASMDARWGFFNYCKKIPQPKRLSFWGRAVWEDALALAEWAEYEGNWTKAKTLDALLLDGADDWTAYAYGLGPCAIPANVDIAARYCTPGELKRFMGGMRMPPEGDWMKVQGRALLQAERLVEGWLSSWKK